MLAHCCLSLVSVLATVPPGSAPQLFPEATSRRRLSPAELEDDFFIFEQTFRDAHPGLDRYLDEFELDEVFAAAAEQLGAGMTIREFYGVLSRVVSAIGCGHTTLEFPADVLMELRERTAMFPLDLVFVEGRAFVLRDLQDIATVEPGCEVLRIQARPFAEIGRELLAHMAGDGDIETGRWALIERRFPYWLHVLVDPAAEFDVLLQRRDGAEFEAHLVGATLPELARRRHERQGPRESPRGRPPFGFRRLEGESIAVLRVDTFSLPELEPFLAETFADLEQDPVEHLVLDVRDNGGGEDELGALLTRYLIPDPHPFYREITFVAEDAAELPYLDTSEVFAQLLAPFREELEDPDADPSLGELLAFVIDRHPQLELQEPMSPGFAGHVYVLQNGGSFSSGTEVPAILHARGRALTIGIETGGTVHGCNAGVMPRLVLPSSRIRARIPLLRYEYAVDDPPPRRRGLIPDVVVPRRIEDLLVGVDTQLEFTLEGIRSGSLVRR